MTLSPRETARRDVGGGKTGTGLCRAFSRRISDVAPALPRRSERADPQWAASAHVVSSGSRVSHYRQTGATAPREKTHSLDLNRRANWITAGVLRDEPRITESLPDLRFIASGRLSIPRPCRDCSPERSRHLIAVNPWRRLSRFDPARCYRPGYGLPECRCH